MNFGWLISWQLHALIKDQRASERLAFLFLRTHWLSCREAFARADPHFSNLQGFGRKSRWAQCAQWKINFKKRAEKEKVDDLRRA